MSEFSIQSMTGFGKGETESENYSLSVEIKTVNHRFKDIRFKMSSLFNSQEIGLKKMIEANFKRGSFDVFINYKKNVQAQKEVELDYDKIKTFVYKMKDAFGEEGDFVKFSPTDFMRNDFYKEDDSKEDELKSLLGGAFEEAVKSLAQSREEEGKKLIQTLAAHRKQYEVYFLKVKDLRNSYQDKVKEKLMKRFESSTGELSIDEPRFLQEVIYYLEKLDIDEEVNRIEIHLQKLDKILSGNGEVGRQIDFLMQELNRETNTIGSKSGSSEISENIVQMKVQLEKIREQALNLQ